MPLDKVQTAPYTSLRACCPWPLSASRPTLPLQAPPSSQEPPAPSLPCPCPAQHTRPLSGSLHPRSCWAPPGQPRFTPRVSHPKGTSQGPNYGEPSWLVFLKGTALICMYAPVFVLVFDPRDYLNNICPPIHLRADGLSPGPQQGTCMWGTQPSPRPAAPPSAPPPHSHDFSGVWLPGRAGSPPGAATCLIPLRGPPTPDPELGAGYS